KLVGLMRLQRVRHREAELAELVLAERRLKGKHHRERDVLAPLSRCLELEDRGVWFAGFREDGPAGARLAVDHERDWESLLGEIRGGGLELHGLAAHFDAYVGEN